ncbi:Vacuolar amino acid transporter 1 [Heracleum sosnowskyi]|uniref:Vacuolar amino acid transporter 1 n=1 Tax=Heracleum sosnowskyi TaxID=360622 RepID=A0AAD8ID21_9APIA|nr:Vacuolar amino acid transporter 1 [Heracleum sosnowskyi]
MDSETHENGYSSVTIPFLNATDEKSHKEEAEILHSTGRTSFFNTCFNGLNALSGVGILSTPFALSSGGWYGLPLLFIIATMAFYTALLIQKIMDADPSIRSYPDIGERAFGRKGRMLASSFMNLELYFVAIGFLILEGDNLHNIFPNGFQLNGLKIQGRESFIMIVALVILPTILLKNLSILSYVSATGVIACVIILGSIIWTGTFDGVGFHERGVAVNLNGIPIAASLYAFCYCGHPVFPTLYTSMRNRKDFTKVMFLCFFLCTLTYSSMAVFGYLMFGADVQSEITLNLPKSKVGSKIAIYTTLVNPIAKYALMVTPIVHSIESRFRSYCNKRSFSLLIRITLLISTIVVALAVPFFELLMSLVGAFLSMSASIILPCMCYLKISGAYQRLGIEVGIIGAILLFGVLIVIAGTYTSLVQIIGQM